MTPMENDEVKDNSLMGQWMKENPPFDNDKESFKDFLRREMRLLNKNWKADDEISEDRSTYNLMGKLQDLGNDKEFEFLQLLLDETDVNDWSSTSLVTIMCVCHWYGDHLNRHDFIERSKKSFKEKNGYDEKYAENL